MYNRTHYFIFVYIIRIHYNLLNTLNGHTWQ